MGTSLRTQTYFRLSLVPESVRAGNTSAFAGYMGTRENKFQSLENLCKHRHNFIVSLISPVVSSVSYEVQHSLSAFGVARNDFFLEDT